MCALAKFQNNLTTVDIHQWLDEIFHDEKQNIPEFEMSKEFMELISRIIFCSKETEKDAKEVIKKEIELVESYNDKSNEITATITSEFNLSDLNPSVLERVKRIAALACKMNLKEPTLTNFLLSSIMVEGKELKMKERDMLDGYNLSKLSDKRERALEKNEKFRRELEILEEIVSSQQSINPKLQSQTTFFHCKSVEYKKRIKKSENRLEEIGYNPSLHHSVLENQAENMYCLEEKVKHLSSKLESYQGLPPSEDLARFKIEEARKEVEKLRNEFHKLME